MAEFGRLPEEAWERQVAIPALLAVRVQIPQDSSDESEREYLMSTQNLYEEWEHKACERGREQEAKRALVMLYEARFGAIPRVLADAIEAAHDVAKLERWLVLIGTRPQEDVAAAIQAEGAALAS